MLLLRVRTFVLTYRRILQFSYFPTSGDLSEGPCSARPSSPPLRLSTVSSFPCQLLRPLGPPVVIHPLIVPVPSKPSLHHPPTNCLHIKPHSAHRLPYRTLWHAFFSLAAPNPT